MLSRTLIGPEAPIGAPPSRSVWAWPGSSLSLAGSRSLRSRGGSARLPVPAHPAGAMMKKSHVKLAYRDRMCAVGRRADIERPYSRTSATPSDRRNAECRQWALIRHEVALAALTALTVHGHPDTPAATRRVPKRQHRGWLGLCNYLVFESGRLGPSSSSWALLWPAMIQPAHS